MTTTLRRTALLAAALPVLALTACGSSSSSDTLNKADIAKKANSICTTFNAKAKALLIDTAALAAAWCPPTRPPRPRR